MEPVLLSPIARQSPNRRSQVRTAKVVRIRRISEMPCSTPAKKLCRRETMSRSSIFRASKRLNESTMEFHCEHCGKKFYHFATLRAHKESLHDDTLPLPTATNATKSNIDHGKFFERLSKELDDELSGIKKRKCKHCGKRYKRKTALKIHVLLKHV